MFALLLGVCAANAQETDTVRYAAGNDLYQGITRKLPYRQMVTPYGVEVTFAKTVHIIFPSAVRYVDLGSKGFRGKRTSPSSARTEVFIPLMPSMPVSRKCSTSK